MPNAFWKSPSNKITTPPITLERMRRAYAQVLDAPGPTELLGRNLMPLNSCPKCGRLQDRAGKNATVTGPFYCSNPTLAQHCVHGRLHGEHLYDRCGCGYELNFRPCADSIKAEGDHAG